MTQRIVTMSIRSSLQLDSGVGPEIETLDCDLDDRWNNNNLDFYSICMIYWLMRGLLGTKWIQIEF